MVPELRVNFESDHFGGDAIGVDQQGMEIDMKTSLLQWTVALGTLGASLLAGSDASAFEWLTSNTPGAFCSPYSGYTQQVQGHTVNISSSDVFLRCPFVVETDYSRDIDTTLFEIYTDYTVTYASLWKTSGNTYSSVGTVTYGSGSASLQITGQPNDLFSNVYHWYIKIPAGKKVMSMVAIRAADLY